MTRLSLRHFWPTHEKRLAEDEMSRRNRSAGAIGFLQRRARRTVKSLKHLVEHAGNEELRG
jgi:hypothetical protein